MKKRYMLCSLVVMLNMQNCAIVHAQDNNAVENVAKVGSTVVYNGMKYKVLSLSNGQGTVELGTGYPVQFSEEQDGKPYELPQQITVDNQEYTVVSIGEEALSFYPDELGAPKYYPSQITLPSTIKTIQTRAFSGSKAKTVIFKENSQIRNDKKKCVY